jgi:DNA-binding MarR family transcriptional regulator
MLAEQNLSGGKAILAVADQAADTTRLAPLAAEFSGLRVLGATLDDAVHRLSEMAQPAVVVLHTAGLTSDRLPLVGELIGACSADLLRVVVVLELGQLDEIGGLLLGTDAILLCDPDDAELAAALAPALADSGFTVRDSGADAARRERIQEEVARFAATLTRIVDRSDGGTGAGTAATPFISDQARSFGSEAAQVDAGEIRRAIRARRLRDEAFEQPGLFEDPAWDMLLDLFAAELERRSVSVSSLCIAAAVAPTTALRWIGKLIDAGLLERRPDAFDRRRAFISLTARASLAMRNYVGMIRRAGLAIA